MITKRDLALIPMEVARAATAPGTGEVDAWEQFAQHLTEQSLDRVQRVVLRLLAQASTADPDICRALLSQADELVAAVRGARDVMFAPTGPLRPRPRPGSRVKSTDRRHDRP